MFDLILESDGARLVVLALLFLAVVALVYFVGQSVTGRAAVRERLDAAAGQHEVDADGLSLRADVTRGRWVDLVNAVEKAGVNLVDTKDETLRKRLIAAGYKSPVAPRVYTLVRLTAVIVLPILVITYTYLLGERPSLVKLYFATIISAAAGLYVPSLFIRAKADRRREAIINGFPDALDLMLVCVEAGLGIETAFSRVGMEMARSHPLLAEQFGAVVLELRAGRSREDALRRMADRAGVDEIRAFATLLIQSTKLGSSVAQTLRTYAAEMRDKRRMRAEEKAHRLPVLLSVPLVGCMLPVMIGVLMVPAVIRMVRVMLPALGGE
ncbi:type II secretion system F family protein [Sphingomicrobium nitratireducens]|uniref:type II secretion system F family protein n=1 Tax=Sphingomicrobium nitratireducens TaxID=2964666 RepID=UPI00223FE3AA|nr:type II secretion system F family protein [Sphingomicrobium nitratireducens]